MTAKREVLNAVKNKLVDACIIVTVTVAMLLALELAARLLNYARVVHGRNDSPTVQKQEWGKQHLEDGEAIAWRYVPYVEFREKAYVSLTINLDSKGRRLVPGSCEKAHAITIWTFGGSTMVGYGAPDQFTIPAYLAVIFNRDGQCIRLVNYGAGGWQSTQSRIQLTQSLARGGRPDSVIFYDGINDVDILTLGRRPGGIAREAETLMAQAFDEHLGLPSQIARHSTLIRILMNRVYKTAQKHRDEERSRIGADIPGYARTVANIYAHNVRMVDALAKEYGFKAYFFLQPFPVISAKKTTALEKTAMFYDQQGNWNLETEVFRDFYRAFGRNTYLAAHPRFFDISGIFDGVNEELFADTAHLLPEGNKIVAERIASEIFLHRGQ